MKRRLKSFGVALLCLVISFVSTLPIQALDSILNTDETIYLDEKVYCDATIDDDFADDCVIMMFSPLADLFVFV